MSVDHTAVVTAMLAAAGLPASQEEIGRLAERYALERLKFDALYDVQEARYADPALVFIAEVDETAWEVD